MVNMRAVQTNLTNLWDLMFEGRYGSLIIYGVGALAQYGAFHYATGRYPGNKGSYAIIHPGEAPIVIDVGGLSPSERREQFTCAIETSRGRVATAAGIGGIPVSELSLVNASMGGERPADLSALVDELRTTATVESERDLRRTARVIQSALEATEHQTTIGDSELLVAARIRSALTLDGAMVDIVQVSANDFRGQTPGQRIIEEGDVLTVFAEAARSDGHWVELGTTYLVGHVNETHEAAALAIHDALSAGIEAATCGDSPPGFEMSRAAGRVGPTTIGIGHTTGIDEGTTNVYPTTGPLPETTVVALHPSAIAHGIAVAAANTVITGVGSLSDYPSTPRRISRRS